MFEVLTTLLLPPQTLIEYAKCMVLILDNALRSLRASKYSFQNITFNRTLKVQYYNIDCVQAILVHILLNFRPLRRSKINAPPFGLSDPPTGSEALVL